MLGDDIIDLSVENDALKNQIGDCDEKWLEESKAKLLKDNDDDKRANLIMSRMKKQMNKQNLIFDILIDQKCKYNIIECMSTRIIVSITKYKYKYNCIITPIQIRIVI